MTESAKAAQTDGIDQTPIYVWCKIVKLHHRKSANGARKMAETTKENRNNVKGQKAIYGV
jgi:hypothetical protein